MPAQPPPLPKDLSEFSRLFGVFFSPSEAFADIARRPRWWIPMILLGIAATVLVASYGQHVGWERVVRQSIEQSSRAENLSVAQREQAIAGGTKVAQVAGYLAIVGPAFTILITSAVLLFIVNNLMGAELAFPSMLGIVGYGYLPGFLKTALATLVMFLKSPDNFDLRNPLMFNVGAFLPDGSARWLVVLGTNFDLFTFWTLALMAAGISVAARRFPYTKALAAVVFPWAIYVMLAVGATVAFG